MPSSRPPLAARATRRRAPVTAEQLRTEANRHDRLAEALLGQNQRVAAALQRGIAMGLREAGVLLGLESTPGT